MSGVDVAAIRKALEKASEGPWWSGWSGVARMVGDAWGGQVLEITGGGTSIPSNDVELIVLLRNNAEALLDELERAQAASEGVDMLIAQAERRGAVKALREAAIESPQAKGALIKRANEIEYPETFGYHVEGGRAFDGQGRPL